VEGELSPKVEQFWRSLPHEWKHPPTEWQEPRFASRWALGSLLAGDAPTAWRLIEHEGEEWFFVVVGDTARLLRYADLEYECRILGPLDGGRYTEKFSLQEGKEQHEIRFEHEPLKLKIEFSAGEPMPENDAELRRSLRVWGARTL
jgi:hypothetical protein